VGTASGGQAVCEDSAASGRQANGARRRGPRSEHRGWLSGVRARWFRVDAVFFLAKSVAFAWDDWTSMREASIVLTGATDAGSRQALHAKMATDGIVVEPRLRARFDGVGQSVPESYLHAFALGFDVDIAADKGQRPQAMVHVPAAIAPHTQSDARVGDGPVH